MSCSCGHIHIFTGHRLQWALEVCLCLAVVLFYVPWYPYWLRLSWARFIYKHQPEHRPLHNMSRSQSAWCWASLHSGLNMLGDMAIIIVVAGLKILGDKMIVHGPCLRARATRWYTLNGPDEFNIYFKNVLEDLWAEYMTYEDKLQAEQQSQAPNSKAYNKANHWPRCRRANSTDGCCPG